MLVSRLLTNVQSILYQFLLDDPSVLSPYHIPTVSAIKEPKKKAKNINGSFSITWDMLYNYNIKLFLEKWEHTSLLLQHLVVQSFTSSATTLQLGQL